MPAVEYTIYLEMKGDGSDMGLTPGTTDQPHNALILLGTAEGYNPKAAIREWWKNHKDSPVLQIEAPVYVAIPTRNIHRHTAAVEETPQLRFT